MMAAPIKIEKGIALPPSHGRPPAPTCIREALAMMKVGESFALCPNQGETITALQRRINASAYHLKQGTTRRFASRQVTEQGVRKVRVWRVA